MNTEDYVSYGQASVLNKKGFNWKCNYCYSILTGKFNDDWCPYDEYSVSAPTLSQTQKWLREEKNVIVTVEPCMLNRKLTGEWYYDVTYVWCKGFTKTLSQSGFNSYEEALSAGITKALELI